MRHRPNVILHRCFWAPSESSRESRFPPSLSAVQSRRFERAERLAVSTETSRSLLLAWPDYREPARRLAGEAAIGCEDIHIHRFPDGESLVRLPQRLPERVIFYASLDTANQRLIELELAAATATELGARQLTLVAPYLCYMRQDKAFHPGEAVSQRIIGELLARRFDTLVTVDPHLHRTPRLADAVPVRRAVAVTAAPLMADWIAEHTRDALLIGPDEESEQWVGAIAEARALEFCVARKQRRGDREVLITLPGDVDFTRRHVVMVDDVASTGHTLATAARQLAESGAACITVLVTHALFSGDALANLRDAGVGQICSTDSILHESNKMELAPLLAAAIGEVA
jgi:ribose-phosphate pyrophosphokinase